MEKRHFIRIAQAYSAKNKLATEIQKTLVPLGNTIFPTKEAAIRKINKRFMATCQEYLKSGGKAQLPDYKEYDTLDGFGVQISDCIIIHSSAVKEEIL